MREGTPPTRPACGRPPVRSRSTARSFLTGGDLITAVDGESVATSADLQTAIAAREPGDTVTLTVERDGESRSVEVELAARPT